MDIVIATNNLGKVKEFQSLLAPYGYTVKSLKDFPEIEEVEETGTSFEENACMKAEYLAKVLDCLVVADDSGLEVDALNGEPGVYSARYAGLEKDDEKNLQLVLENLKDVAPENKTARFICVMALAKPGELTKTYRGVCEGMIIDEKKWTNGFGYDPIFYFPPCKMTSAMMSMEEKNKYSHRAKALKKLYSILKEML